MAISNTFLATPCLDISKLDDGGGGDEKIIQTYDDDDDDDDDHDHDHDDDDDDDEWWTMNEVDETSYIHGLIPFFSAQEGCSSTGTWVTVRITTPIESSRFETLASMLCY